MNSFSQQSFNDAYRQVLTEGIYDSNNFNTKYRDLAARAKNASDNSNDFISHVNAIKAHKNAYDHLSKSKDKSISSNNLSHHRGMIRYHADALILAEGIYDNKPKKSDIPAITRKKADPQNWKVTLDDLEKERTSNLSHLRPNTPSASTKIKTEAVGRLNTTTTPTGTSVTSTTGRINATITPNSTTVAPAATADLKLDKTLPSTSDADRAATIRKNAANRTSSATYGESVGYADYLNAAMIRFGINAISELDEDSAKDFFHQIDEALSTNNVDYIVKAQDYLDIMEQIDLDLAESNIVGIALDEDSNYVVSVELDDTITQHIYQFDK